jgi:MFS family permease
VAYRKGFFAIRPYLTGAVPCTRAPSTTWWTCTASDRGVRDRPVPPATAAGTGPSAAASPPGRVGRERCRRHRVPSSVGLGGVVEPGGRDPAFGLPVLAVRLTDSPALVAGVSIAVLTPMALLALPAGVVADRYDRRRVLVLANVVRLVALAVAMGAVVVGELHLAVVYAAAALAGGSEILADTTAQTTVPALVDADGLPAANARLGGTQVVMSDAIGAPMGSFLAGVTVGFAFGVPALLYAVAALLVRRLPLRARPAASQADRTLTGVVADAREGIRELRRHDVLGRLALVSAASNLGNTAFGAVLVLLVVGPLDLPSTTYGWFVTALAAGGILGSLVAGRVLAALGHATTIKAATGVAVLTYAVAGTTSDPAVFAGSMLALGALSMVWNVASRVLRQTLVPDAILGRVTASMAVVALVATPIGGVLGGAVAEALGVRAVSGVAVGANLLALLLLAPVTRARVEAARDRVAERVVTS